MFRCTRANKNNCTASSLRALFCSTPEPRDCSGSKKYIVPVVDFFAALQMCYNFLSGSNVHSIWIAFQKDMYPDQQPIQSKTMSDTRWACQVRAVSAKNDRFECLVKFHRHADSTDNNRDRALVARSISD